MKSPARPLFFGLITAAFLLAACSPRATSVPAAPAVQDYVLPEATAAQPYRADSGAPLLPEAQKNAGVGAEAPAPGDMPGANVIIQTGSDTLTGLPGSDRMVIKDGQIRLLVQETDTALDRTLQVVGDVRGYVISSRTWYQTGPDGQNYKYASLTIGVPADQFENALRRLRGIAVRVLDENASGQDVSDEYVDLQSQLTNLEATRARIRSFLDNAQTVEESLRINSELAKIEAEIEKVKGRMNYLSNRAAFSTITITLEPEIPPLTPTPTPTLTPTPTPQPWNPGSTVDSATKTLTRIYRALIELAIWVVIVIVPLIAPPALLFWGILKLATRKKTPPARSGE
ncbi:MAG: DUF4349 domain-containing protein [Anaerolineales bacterium]|nr:DUF4349 domain-containing protein [Anaerolineales bacterium]